MSDEKKTGPDVGESKEVKVQPASAADELGRLNPSSPGETGTTPGTNGKPVDGAGPEAAKP